MSKLLKFEATELPYKLPQFLSERAVRVFVLTDLMYCVGAFQARA